MRFDINEKKYGSYHGNKRYIKSLFIHPSTNGVGK